MNYGEKMKTLGERVEFLRKQIQITQQELGDIVELHGSNIGRIEKGKVYPTSDVLLKMSIYFGVSCDWLLTGKNAETQTCENADEANLLFQYRKLSEIDKADIQTQIEYKLYKAEKEKNVKLSNFTDTSNNFVV